MTDLTPNKTVLAPYYLNASDAEILKAVTDIEIELLTRRERERD